MMEPPLFYEESDAAQEQDRGESWVRETIDEEDFPDFGEID